MYLESIPIFIIVIITYFALKFFIKLSSTFSLYDIPNQRSSHKVAIPRGAGIVFGIIFILSLIIYNFAIFTEYKYVLLAIAIVWLGGILDDIYTLTSKQKILFILVASIIVYFNGFQITNFGTYFSYTLEFGYLTFPLTIFLILGCTNTINLIDGLDGLAGSISIIILASILTIGVIHNDDLLITWSAILIAILSAFLILNWHPAKVFMGDSGSLLLGFVITLLSIKTLDYVNTMSMLFLVAVPILDTLIVFRRRIQRKQSPFSADKNHLHHILNNMKRSKTFTVQTLIKIQLAFSLIFLQANQQDDMTNLIIFIILFSIFFNLFDPRFRIRGKNSRIKKQHKKLKKEENK